MSLLIVHPGSCGLSVEHIFNLHDLDLVKLGDGLFRPEGSAEKRGIPGRAQDLDRV